MMFEAARLMAGEARGENERALFGQQAINSRYRELDEREARLDERDERVTARESGAEMRDDDADEREAQTDASRPVSRGRAKRAGAQRSQSA
jgi:hypothetical protein